MNLKKIVLFSLLALFVSTATGHSATFAPPAAKTLLLIGQDRDTIVQYIKATGDVPAGTMLYTSVQEMKELDNPINNGSGVQHGSFLLETYPQSVIQIGLYMVNALDGVLSGQYEDNLKKLAVWIKKANRPVYLRIGYEFDLPENRYEAEKYKTVFRYIVDFLRRQGVTNVAYVWHSYGWENPKSPWVQWYPGDDYVDWFGVSLFGTQQLPTAKRLLNMAREHHKPFMIAESTPNGLYTVRGKVDWFKHVFHFIEENNIEAFCYINSNWDVEPMWKGQNWGDARIQKYDEIKKIWLEETSNIRYMKASPDLFQTLGWKKENKE